MARTPEQIEELLDKVEGLLKSWDDANDKFDRSEWNKKYGERFGQYSDKLKKLNGDDFDILSASYDEHKNSYSDYTDDEYTDALEANIKKVVARVWPDATSEEAETVASEVTEAVEGEAEEEKPEGEGLTEAHVEVEDKDGDGDITEDEVETHTLSEGDGEAENEGEAEESTSDARQKRIAKMKSNWTGSPHTSGGREGHTSDEGCKESLDDKEEEKVEKKKEYDPLDRLY